MDITQEATLNTAGDLLASGKAITQVQTNYATAVSVQVPRDLKRVAIKCVDEAQLAGDSFYYRWTVQSKGKTSVIQGPSINCTLAAIRNFGNCVVQQRPVQETRTAFIFTAAAIDLETGFTIERSFRISKDFPIFGKMDIHRKEDIRFQIAQSKAIRNVVGNFVPTAILDKMVDVAMGSIRSKIEEKIKAAGGDINAVIDNLLKAFAQVEVDEARITDYLGIPRKAWNVETLTLLSGDLKAISNGTALVDEIFPKPADADGSEPAEKPPGSDVENGMSKGDPNDRQDYERGTGKNNRDEDTGKPPDVDDKRQALIDEAVAFEEDHDLPDTVAKFREHLKSVDIYSEDNTENDIALYISKLSELPLTKTAAKKKGK